MADPFCNCCAPAAPATPLAVYNRPGLSAIAYRVGTFSTFREAMLEAIAGGAALAGLTSRESTDHAITLVELWAAAGDVLTFYSERIANELFLRTARERDSALRLTRLLGYRLRPGLAAQTKLSFALDPSAHTRIRKGLKVMSVPGQDEKPQVFETTEEIVADADLNEARAYAPPVPFNGFAHGSTGGPIVSRPPKLAVGDRLVLFGRTLLEEKIVEALEARGDGEHLAFAPGVGAANSDGNEAQAAKVEGRLRFFGHGAPKIVNVYVPPEMPTGWPRWEAKTVDFALDPPDSAYPLDGKHTDIVAGHQLLIDTAASDAAKLVAATVLRTDERPAVMRSLETTPVEIESLRDTVTHLYLRRTIGETPGVAGALGGTAAVLARSAGGAVLQLDPPTASPRRWTVRPDVAATSPVTAVAAGALRRDAFVRDGSGALQHARMPGGVFTGWANRGGVLTSEPRAAAEAGGQVLAFVRGLDLGLWILDVTGETTGTWTGLGGVLTSAPAPVSPAPGGFAAVVRGLDRGVWYRVRDGAGWHPWTALGGTLATGPTAASTGANRIDIAGLDDAGALVHRRFDGTDWGEWRNLGGQFRDAIALVPGAPDRMDAFARGTDGAVWTIARTGENWGTWTSLGGAPTSAPAATRDNTGLHVYVRGGDGALASRSFSGSAWGSWASHGDGIGPIAARNKTTIWRLASVDIVFRPFDYPAKIEGGRVAIRLKPGGKAIGALAKGRRILLCAGERVDEAHVTAATPVSATLGGLADHLFVDFTPAPVAPLRDAILLGNVAAASHGETQPLEALGHGDGATAFQPFRLARPNLTHLQSATNLAGQAALEIRVNGELWKETPSFFGRRADERLYTARANGNAETTVTFGDGTTGARLPSGAMNVTGLYRTGLGLAGLMKAGQLSIPLERPPGLRGVSNPLPADGAADPETRDTARENAPKSVKTFGRAVSLADFEAIATASGLAARGCVTWVWSERERAVHVTVAGPNGTKLSAASLALLRGALDTARDPNRPLTLANVVRVPIVVSARLLRNPDFEADAMLADARARLLAFFAFDAMPLGAAVFASDIYATLQEATGVLAVDVDVFQLKGFGDFTAAEQKIRAVDRRALQPHIRIFPARPTPPPAEIDRFAKSGFSGAPPPVLPAEQAFIAEPAADLVLTAVEAL
jgi:hypothetical protein